MRSVIWQVMRDRRFHRMVLLGLALALGMLFAAMQMGWTFADVKSVWFATEAFLAANPWCLFLGLVFLPGLPVPVSPLVFLAGTVWHDRPLMACGICLLALVMNFCWTYWMSAKPARGLVERWLKDSKTQIPTLPKGNDLKLILVLRLTPGMPLFVQNYVLGFLRVPFALYLAVSMACSGVIACGVVLTGAGVGDGQLTPILAGIGLLIVAAVVLSVVRKKLGGSVGGKR